MTERRPARVTGIVESIYGEHPHDREIDHKGLWNAIVHLDREHPMQDGSRRWFDLANLRYRQNETHRAIGELWGVSPTRIRHLEAKLLRYLRHPTHRAMFERAVSSDLREGNQE